MFAVQGHGLVKLSKHLTYWTILSDCEVCATGNGLPMPLCIRESSKVVNGRALRNQPLDLLKKNPPLKQLQVAEDRYRNLHENEIWVQIGFT